MVVLFGVFKTFYHLYCKYKMEKLTLCFEHILVLASVHLKIL